MPSGMMVVVFRSRLREGVREKYGEREAEVWSWAKDMPGFVSSKDFVAEDGERVVGQAATILVEVKVDDEVRRAVWILDFILLPEYRGQKLGKRLLQLARQTYPTMLALGYNQMSGNVLTSLEWVRMGMIDRYQRLLFPGYGLKEVAGIAPLRSLINLAYAPFRPSRSKTLPNTKLAIREIGDFDSAFDELWQRVSKNFPCAIERRSAFLNWQFRRQPGKRFEVFGVYTGERLVGYAVLFFRKPEHAHAPAKAAITDICYDPENGAEIVDELLKTALRQSLERQAGSLVTDVRDPLLVERLRSFGFFRIKRAPPFMVYSPNKRELMYEPDNWFLTRADSDVSIFEAPNL
jgi:GNAT superfamily N-acetyltransferase